MMRVYVTPSDAPGKVPGTAIDALTEEKKRCTGYVPINPKLPTRTPLWTKHDSLRGKKGASTSLEQSTCAAFTEGAIRPSSYMISSWFICLTTYESISGDIYL